MHFLLCLRVISQACAAGTFFFRRLPLSVVYVTSLFFFSHRSVLLLPPQCCFQSHSLLSGPHIAFGPTHCSRAHTLRSSVVGRLLSSSCVCLSRPSSSAASGAFFRLFPWKCPSLPYSGLQLRAFPSSAASLGVWRLLRRVLFFPPLASSRPLPVWRLLPVRRRATPP